MTYPVASRHDYRRSNVRELSTDCENGEEMLCTQRLLTLSIVEGAENRERVRERETLR